MAACGLEPRSLGAGFMAPDPNCRSLQGLGQQAVDLRPHGGLVREAAMRVDAVREQYHGRPQFGERPAEMCPVKPVCQIVRARPLAPNRRGWSLQPIPRTSSPVLAWRLLIRATEPADRTAPGTSARCINRANSAKGAKSPAWPETPPRAYALPSWTSPQMSPGPDRWSPSSSVAATLAQTRRWANRRVANRRWASRQWANRRGIAGTPQHRPVAPAAHRSEPGPR